MDPYDQSVIGLKVAQMHVSFQLGGNGSFLIQRVEVSAQRSEFRVKLKFLLLGCMDVCLVSIG